MEALKKFALNSATSSLADRRKLFEEIFAVFSSDVTRTEIPEAAYKLLGKMTYYLFPVYTDKTSKEDLIKLNGYLIEFNIDSSLKPLLSSLEAHSKLCAVNSPSRNLTNLSLYGVDVLNGLILSINRHHKIDYMRSHGEEMSKLAIAYSNFVLGSCLNLKEKNLALAYKKLKSVLKQIAELDDILEKGVLSTENAESLTNRLLFMGFLMRFYNENNKSDRLNDLKNRTMEIYINSLIDSRVKPKRWLVKCSNYWLRYATKDDFKEKLLVEVRRSLLRNPEIVLEAVGYLLEDLAIDLSDFSADLMKVLGSQLLAKDETSQNESASAFKSLSTQCSSLEAIQAMIKHLFSVLNGAEGKLTVPSQKVAILTAIGNVSSNCCSNIHEILPQLLQSFGDYLKLETHEASLVFALEQLNKWLKSLKLKSIPDDHVTKLNAFFKTLLENKNYSHAVKNAVFLNMVTIYSNSQMTSHIVGFAPICMSLIEKTQTAAASTNSLIIGEGLSAALLLAILLASDSSIESKIPNFLNLITDSKKQTFTNEKFLYSLNEQGLINYCMLFEKLCEIFANKDRVDISKFYIGYLFVLLSPQYSVRKFAQETIRKLLKWNSNKFLLSFLDSIEPCLAQFTSQSTSADAQADSGGGTDALKWPSNKAICEALLVFSSTPNLTQAEFDSTMQKSLLPANLPRARSVDPNLYEKCIRRLLEVNKSNLNSSLKFDDLIRSQMQALVELSIGASSPSEKELNACETLCRLDASQYLSRAVAYALELLENATRLRTVTKQEWEIMRLKDGEVYDRQLIDSAIKQIQESANQPTNLKRENKAYSYKEQMAELELRKEIEAKKGGANKFDPSALTLDQIRSHMTKKQQEMLDAQIATEKRIRDEMLELDAIASKATSILSRAIDARPNEVKARLSAIIRTFSGLLRSPIAAGYVLKIMKEISRKVFHDQEKGTLHVIVISFYDSVVYTMLRLIDAPIPIEPEWKEEPVEKAYKRIIAALKSEFTIDFDDFELDLAKMAFVYPFLKNASLSSSIDENTLKDLIEIIHKFATYRNSTQNDLLIELKQLGPKEEPDADSMERLKEIVNNFLSSEYLVLLLNLIQLVNDRKFTIQLQFQAAQVCKSMFDYSAHFVFASDKLAALVCRKTGQFEFLENYNKDVKVICEALANSVVIIRETSLTCLGALINDKNVTDASVSQKFNLDSEIYELLAHRLQLTCYDEEETNRETAKTIWSSGQFKTSESLCLLVLNDLVHPSEHVRQAAAESLAEMLKTKHMSVFPTVMHHILDTYDAHNVLPEPKKDQFGRVSATDIVIDDWESRAGLAYGLKNLAPILPDRNAVISVFEFFVNKSLNDRNQAVRGLMLEAAVVCLDHHGKTNMNDLLPLFENFLQDTPKDAKYDSVRVNVVILMGTLAKHLDKDDAKVAPIIGKLVQALQTPSQQVQEAVAHCLPPLMPAIKSQVPTYINQLLTLLLSAQNYGERRGAAYGLAGMLKGVGMLSLRQLNVLQRLNDAVNNKNDPKQREGALIGYEMLTVMFQKIFEPYSVEILPNLLLCFGDADPNVRQAADECAKAIMANLTFTGVKMILPKLLERLGEEESWRTKCGSVELLGNMAHCAPKQLSTCLPSIVPKLIEVLSDSHVKVQKAGTQALRHIGSVIKNPEIQMITDILLEALQDPAVKTQKALQTLLETKFVHFIDAPSLALIMPVVQRAFQDRSTEIRKMAAQIMGNMYSLTDQKDLQPYLPSILPGIKLSLLDPVPEVRSVSAKALGSLISAIGENGLNEIIAWLMEKLVSEQSSVDRSGAAQGLSEVFGSLGVAKLEKSMPEIIERAAQVDLSPYVRDGYIMMFIYLPLTFGDDFASYVGLIIQPILKALADDSEFVRDTAIKAGQRVVNMYADTAISLFLPELEKGLFDINWRIRFSSVQLLGDLLYKVSGVQGKMTTESAHEDDNFGTEKGSTAIVRSLGEERRNRIFSGLYMGRSDVSLQVRQASLHIWKVIVANTPKTLKEILPTLFNLLLGCLASANPDKRQIAASTLVDIVKKLGERVLPDIIPILERGLNSERAEQRQGVCIGLTEIMASTSRDNILAFSDSLVPTVRKALMDPLPEVRATAARTFDNLHNMIGSKALEEVGVSLLDEMKRAADDEKSAERALDALKQIMLVKSRVMLPFLIPYLTQPPVNINALCKLCCSASTEALSRHLSKILHTLVQALALTLYNDQSSTHKAEWVNECEHLLLSIEEHDGVKTIVTDLLAIATNVNEKPNARLAALDMLTWFCSKTEADYSDYLDDLTKSLLNLLSDKSEQLLSKAWLCLAAVIDQLKGVSLIQRLPTIRQSIRVITQFHLNQTNRFYSVKAICCGPEDLSSVVSKMPHLPGFCLPKKGISCVLPIFKEGLLNGAPEIKEQSAQTLCECIKLSDGESLKSSVMAITGPLIRVLGERYSWQVKSAILDAIYFLLLKVDITLKPFLPQLQPTFLKNLNDTNRLVRLKSGYALAKLLGMNPRLDQVLLDLINYVKQAQDEQIRETVLNTIRLCLNSVGTKLADETKNQLLTLLRQEQYLYSQEYAIRSVTAGALGSLSPYLTEKDFDQLFQDVLDYQKYTSKNWTYLQSNCMLIAIAIQYSPQRLINKTYEMKLLSFIKSCASSDRTPISMSALRAICYYLDYKIKNGQKSDIDIATVLAKCVNQLSNDVKLLSVQIVTFLSVLNNTKRLDDDLLKLFIPMLVNGTREKSPQVKLASEIALIELLQLKAGNTIYEESIQILDIMKESFQDCVKSLSKESFSANVSLDEFNIDETLIKLE